VSRIREIRLSGSMWRGPETERWTTLNGHESWKRRTQPRADLHATAVPATVAVR
jgi:hypothetical protein